ncbi:ABC transporter substrate-binding protein [Paracoccus cavernae]|uniref:ABC transporter substrate-binding protein n=1 Tax=Paracoccus cavernae TaxID=1571207 RepID=A0ABT8DBU0_9RHOB|nr:ABC transporter substrate-binding protein [Paracoccus cavernae]
MVSSPNVLTYNTTLYKECPIKNLWDLTDPEWKGKLAMQDPLGKPSYTDWFNQMRSHADDKVAAAYEAKYGKKLETDAPSATEAFVTALAANGPLLTDSDSAAADAVAANGQTEPFVGLVSAAKFRDNEDGKLTLGLCNGVDPFIGFLNSTVGLIVKGTNSPNAAKLFIHYAMTGEGIAPQGEDGKISSNRTVQLPADEPSGISKHLGEVLAYDPRPAWTIGTAGRTGRTSGGCPTRSDPPAGAFRRGCPGLFQDFTAHPCTAVQFGRRSGRRGIADDAHE